MPELLNSLVINFGIADKIELFHSTRHSGINKIARSLMSRRKEEHDAFELAALRFVDGLCKRRNHENSELVLQIT